VDTSKLLSSLAAKINNFKGKMIGGDGKPLKPHRTVILNVQLDTLNKQADQGEVNKATSNSEPVDEHTKPISYVGLLIMKITLIRLIFEGWKLKLLVRMLILLYLLQP
jgi:hypothetical protein